MLMDHSQGSTPLIRAAFAGRTEVARILIDANANVDCKNRYVSAAEGIARVTAPDAGFSRARSRGSERAR